MRELVERGEKGKVASYGYSSKIFGTRVNSSLKTLAKYAEEVKRQTSYSTRNTTGNKAATIVTQ